MPSSEKKRGMWMGHPLLAPEDEHELHLAAALHEFQGGMPRQDAEKRALQDYRNEHHARAAAHHYSGMKASHATGNMDDAKKHHALYSLHLKALGEDPMGPVPEAVRKYGAQAGQSERQKHVYRFRGHDADDYLVQPVTKSELEVIDLKKAEDPREVLRAAVNRVISGIDLGPVVDYLADKAGVETKVEEPAAPVEMKKAEPVNPVKDAAHRLGQTLDIISSAKAVLAQLQAK